MSESREEIRARLRRKVAEAGHPSEAEQQRQWEEHVSDTLEPLAEALERVAMSCTNCAKPD